MTLSLSPEHNPHSNRNPPPNADLKVFKLVYFNFAL